MSESKLIKLDSILNELRSFVVGFSGGLDSAFLIHRANMLNDLNFVAVTIQTAFIPAREIEEAVEFTSGQRINHRVIEVSFPGEIRNNPSDRCYLCKRILFTHIVDFSRKNGYKHIIDGTNADDKNLFRPGLRALREMHVRSPLAESGLTKQEIRQLAHKAGLALWNKPAMACLLTRIPYDTEISEKILGMIEKAENYLYGKGFPGTRVRVHGDTARIECSPGYFIKLINDSVRESIVTFLKSIGFRYISLDLEGYKTGSMDQNISEK